MLLIIITIIIIFLLWKMFKTPNKPVESYNQGLNFIRRYECGFNKFCKCCNSKVCKCPNTCKCKLNNKLNNNKCNNPHNNNYHYNCKNCNCSLRHINCNSQVHPNDNLNYYNYKYNNDTSIPSARTNLVIPALNL